MLNQITLMGRMTRDPELRQTPGGSAVANFSLAVERDIKDKASGERVTDFIDCVAWAHTANFVSKYCTKGSLVVVSGRLQIRDWTDKDGNKRRGAEVVVNDLYFAEKKNGNSSNSESDTPSPRPAPLPANNTQDDDDDSMPF